jgi:hypothetical protein
VFLGGQPSAVVVDEDGQDAVTPQPRFGVQPAGPSPGGQHDSAGLPVRDRVANQVVDRDAQSARPSVDGADVLVGVDDDLGATDAHVLLRHPVE